MLAKVISAAVHGVEALLVTVETDISKGLPALNIVGLADITVKEAKERIRSAILNSGITYPNGRITINMAPAAIKKKGSHFDLAMAIGILASSNQIFDDRLDSCCFIGELSLDGSINKCDGILPMVMAMRERGIKRIFIPKANREEAVLIEGVSIYPVETLEDIVDHFNLNNKLSIYSKKDENYESRKETLTAMDFKDVKGQEYAKRAITIAVAGGHGILMMGSPSTGKTMISQRIPTIMPKMTFDEIVETTAVYSVAGLLNEEAPYITTRPFRQPHHKITPVGLLGGGAYPRPGEISLASKGVLFLDEVGEFEKNLIDTLRLPLEQKSISLIRKGETYTFPADFMIVAATNPCKCGYFGDPTHKCTCKESEIKSYQSKISGPILDRIDMHIKLLPILYKDLENEKSKSSKEMAAAIEKARDLQRERYKALGLSLNHQIDDHLVEEFCPLDEAGIRLISAAYDRLKLNPRTLLKVKKVARTIADLENCKNIEEFHLAEALQYREVKE